MGNTIKCMRNSNGRLLNNFKDKILNKNMIFLHFFVFYVIIAVAWARTTPLWFISLWINIVVFSYLSFEPIFKEYS